MLQVPGTHLYHYYIYGTVALAHHISSMYLCLVSIPGTRYLVTCAVAGGIQNVGNGRTIIIL